VSGEWYRRMRDLFEASGYLPPPPPSQTRDLGAARAARDEALEITEERAGEWFVERVKEVMALPKGMEFTGEDLRYLLLERGAPDPPNPTNNVWGSLIGHCSRLKVIERTGERRPMRQVTSHGRMTDVWRCV
jgi:hypothetical protein